MAKVSLAALGVVFGDIGTSPLYAMRECFSSTHDIAVNPENVLGILSLIVWSITLVISIKYLVFILRADNQGEGGILALTALVTHVRTATSGRPAALMMMGLFGAALLYADGMITPAITVLSAVEGLKVATPAFERFLQPITIGILVALFLVQSRGTARVGALFGPITLIWFATIAIIGLAQLVQRPSILASINPWYALSFFWHNGWAGFTVLGGVFMVVTGGEALYADIGHFGRHPIRMAWFVVVMPALLLNYLGQGAFLLRDASGVENPFYSMAPPWALLPLVVLATAAASVASQAIITGAFSLTLQAVQLGFSPRMKIDHTSPNQIGQIYVATVNWVLMAACIGLVIGFGSSINLTAAYGVAISCTMVITTLLFFELVTQQWKWSLPLALSVTGGFIALESMFFFANIAKIWHGGWFPLLVAAVLYTCMSTWMAGRQLLGKRLRERLVPLELFLANVLTDKPARVPGTAVFLSGNPIGTPPALRHNYTHNRILHECVLVLTVETAERPRVPPRERFEVEEVGEGFFRAALRYGFMDAPNIPRDLRQLRDDKLKLDVDQISYFLGRETLLATTRPGMARWREHLFIWLSRNSQTATHYFHLPSEQVIEVGIQVEL